MMPTRQYLITVAIVALIIVLIYFVLAG